MEDYVILGIVSLIALGAISTLIRRAGRKGCCGSAGDYKPRKKKLKKILYTKTFVVEGMHCEKCANRVTEAVNDIDSVAGVVNLKKGTVAVSYGQEVSDEQIKAYIERHGYVVEAIL